MVCGACGTSFEVESAGTRIRLAAAPPALAARTAGLLDAWLTPAELLLLLERATPASPGSPFEPVAAALTASPPATTPAALPPAASSQARPPAAPRASKSANRAPTAPDAEPGTDDWFASLAAVIGGTSPVNPPSDAVLADELERALLGRPESEIGAAAHAVVAGDIDAPLVPAATLAPAAPRDAALLAAILAPVEPKTADQVLAEAIAALSAPIVPAALPAAPTPLPDVNPPVAPPGASQPSATAAPTDPIANYQLPISPGATTALVPSAANVPVAPAPPAISGPPSSRRELAERAWKLHELGNTLNSIRSTLEGSGGTPDDIRVIMEKLIALEQARRARFQRNLQWALAGGLTVVFVLLAIAIVISSLASPSAPAPTAAPRLTAVGSAAPGPGTPTPAGTRLLPTPTLAYNPIIAIINGMLPGDVKFANGPSPTPAATSAVLGSLFPATPTLSPQDLATKVANSSGLPSWVATLVPSGITVLNVPTPSVESKGPPSAPCPTTSAQASALFGGPAGSWSFSHQEQGWILILADKPTSIRIPDGMSAGYLVIGETLEMRSALGPATVNNVNFIAVSCQ